MRTSGGKRLNNPKKVLCCNVTFLDEAVATYEIPKDAKGGVLYQSVIRSLDLNCEAKYFGLLFTDEHNFSLWLDHDKKVLPISQYIDSNFTLHWTHIIASWTYILTYIVR